MLSQEKIRCGQSKDECFADQKGPSSGQKWQSTWYNVCVKPKFDPFHTISKEMPDNELYPSF